MKKLFFAFSVVLTIFLPSCNSKTNQTGEHDINSPSPHQKEHQVPLSQLAAGTDLVCGMPLEEGGIADTILHEGKIYGFCASECKAEFSKDPVAYLSQSK